MRAVKLGDFARSVGPWLLREEQGKSTETGDAQSEGEARRAAIEFQDQGAGRASRDPRDGRARCS